MRLRKCNIYDIEELINLGRKTYYDTFYLQNTKEIMDQYLGEAFAFEKISKELNNLKSSFYFLYNKNLLVGYMKVNFSPAQTDINDPESLELERIYLIKESIGKGYGKFMINHVFTLARENGLKKVWLDVWEKNTYAISFYQSMGFEIIDRHTFRMGDEIQDDYVLQKNLRLKD